MLYPLDGGKEWFVAQPDDWLWDMAIAEGQAARAEVEQRRSTQRQQGQPPSPAFTERQHAAMERDKARIAELEAKPGLTPEDDLELADLRSHLKVLIDPANFSRADELMLEAENRAIRTYLLRYLIIDADGVTLFNPDRSDGRRRWNLLDGKTRDALRGELEYVLTLIRMGKNSYADESSP